MSNQEKPSPHAVGLQILQGLDNILSGLQGTREEHQQRLNSLQFLSDRLKKLHDLEQQAAAEADQKLEEVPSE